MPGKITFSTEAEGGSPRWLADYQRILVNAFVDIESTGFPFDTLTHRKFITDASRVYDKFEDKLRSHAGFQAYCRAYEVPGEGKKRFNFGSPTQLRKLLFLPKWQKGFGLESIKQTKAGAASTDRESLKSFADDGNEFCTDLLTLRNFGKLLQAFGEPLLEHYSSLTGAVHPSYFLAKVIDSAGVAGGTHTGRLSCKHPNLQQIPKRDKDDKGIGLAGVDVRRAFVPLPGHVLIEADQSQVEVRVAGMYAKDEQMGQFFKMGGDFHTRVASQVFKADFDELQAMLDDKQHAGHAGAKQKRTAAKRFTFGLMFGMGLLKLCLQSGLTEAEGTQFINEYFATFPQFAQWREETIQYAKDEGYATTLFGRKRLLKVSGYATDDGREERIGINTPIQSAAADITLYGLSRIWEMLLHRDAETKILGTVHDSIIFSMPPREVNQFLPIIANMMMRPPGLEWLLDDSPVPLSVGVDIGPNFRDMVELDLSQVLSGDVKVKEYM